MTATLDVLVVDDSRLLQLIIVKLLECDPRIKVVGVASDGQQAIEKVHALRPDVVTMDIQMPKMDGLEALRRIMQQAPTPVVMLSGLTDASAAIQALQLGAIEFIAKPSGTVSLDLFQVRDELISKIKLATLVNLDRAMASINTPAPPLHLAPGTDRTHQSAIAFASSTGGPRALEKIFRQLPAGLPASVFVVQHMPVGFTASFAKRLDQHSPIHIEEAQDGQAVKPGEGYVAPAGRHMSVVEEKGQPIIRLLDTPPVNSVRPSADVLLASVAEVFGRHSIGGVLTGMGKDGRDGAARIKACGGFAFAQDRATSTIFGMPKAAIEQGVVDKVLPLTEIAYAIIQVLQDRIGAERAGVA